MVSFVFVYLSSSQGLCKLTTKRPETSQLFCIGTMMPKAGMRIGHKGLSLLPTFWPNRIRIWGNAAILGLWPKRNRPIKQIKHTKNAFSYVF